MTPLPAVSTGLHLTTSWPVSVVDRARGPQMTPAPLRAGGIRARAPQPGPPAVIKVPAGELRAARA
jgi:hypothetical protein